MKKPRIIQDTREKQAVNLDIYGYETVIAKLDVGDYSVEGMESQIFIERKASTGELSNNLGKKKDVFFRELERAKDIPFKYIVCEFSYDDILCFPENSKIPPAKRRFVRMNPGFIISSINKIQEKYDVVFYFCGSKDNATQKIAEIIEECLKKIEI